MSLLWDTPNNHLKRVGLPLVGRVAPHQYYDRILNQSSAFPQSGHTSSQNLESLKMTSVFGQRVVLHSSIIFGDLSKVGLDTAIHWLQGAQQCGVFYYSIEDLWDRRVRGRCKGNYHGNSEKVERSRIFFSC